MTTATDSLPWVVLILVLALLLVPVLLVLLVMPMMGFGMMGWGMGGEATVSPVLAVVSGLVPLVLLVAVGYLAYRAFAGRGRRGGDPAIEELRMAFARGDLSREEFEERRELLERRE